MQHRDCRKFRRRDIESSDRPRHSWRWLRQLCIEQLEDRLMLATDFGDAPFPYATLLATDGARHQAIGPTLGMLRDTELDGHVSPLADGDDTIGAGVNLDDEDGVVFGTVRVGQLGASVTVNVQGAPAGAKLDAWIDFNGDGSWGAWSEHVFDSVLVVEGDNLLSFDVPSNSISGNSFARFRLSEAGSLGPTGPAVDGEVEDYVVEIAAPRESSSVFEPRPSIGWSLQLPLDVVAADMDRDGDMDALSALRDDNKIVWFENDGSQSFFTHEISTTANGASRVLAIDIDGDDDLDVVCATYSDDVLWFENDGHQQFTGRSIPGDVISYPTDLTAADMDGDGDPDLLVALSSAAGFAWYENDGSAHFARHEIVNSLDRGVSVQAADIDHDGDLDVLAASSYQDVDKIMWYENDGSQSLTEHVVGSDARGITDVFAGDLDGDGDFDLLSASWIDDKIAWYENDGSQNFSVHTITAQADGARRVLAADMEGDGDLDVLFAAPSDTGIDWFENEGNGIFRSRAISGVGEEYAVVPADVDGDGDLDVLAANYESIIMFGSIYWFENLDAVDFGDAPFPYDSGSSVYGTRHLAVGPTLGVFRDSEGLPQRSDAANGDDNNPLGRPDDEDGVTFGTMRVGQIGASVIVNVQNAPNGARLDAWIDFDADGSFAGPGEQIARSLPVVNGDNMVTFNVPSGAASGKSYGRFRLSTAGNLTSRTSVSEIAADGEVEDYQIDILPPTASSGFGPSVHSIATDKDLWAIISAADIDGDGDTDLVSASTPNDEVFWFRNDGGGNFAARTIDSAFDSPSSVFAADVDCDGDMDVLATSALTRLVVWYENIGSYSFVRHTITTAVSGATSVCAADMDDDSDIDVLTSSAGDDKIAWYENNGSEAFTQHVISTAVNGASWVAAGNLSGSGELDVLAVSPDDGKIVWFKHSGGSYVAATVDAYAGGIRRAFIADIDNDGRMDIVAGNNWYAGSASGFFGLRTISSSKYSAYAVADLDGDGDVDIVAGQGVNEVFWLENIDSGSSFKTHTVLANEYTGKAFVPVDIDIDGDLDLVFASGGTDQLGWFENSNEIDFGDAPSPYPTTLAESGARHRARGPMLGVSRDLEADGEHSASANAASDEDGVVLGMVRVGQLGASVAVNVQNAPTGAKLDAWIDFNRDGNWGGPGEQIFDSRSVIEGENSLSFDVPSWALAGGTIARFRLSTAGDLGITGLGDDGEVEDYELTIASPTTGSGTFTGPIVISTTADGASRVFAIDLDRDGDVDVLSSSANDDRIVWYENNGQQTFSARTISTTANGASGVYSADVDGDGDLDVLSSSDLDHKIAWFENNGNQVFLPHTISTTASGARSVLSADGDGDGDLDILVVTPGSPNDQQKWYINDGDATFRKQSLGLRAAFYPYVADVDGDGDLDVLSGGNSDNEIGFLEYRPGWGYYYHAIAASVAGLRGIFATDLDGDGDVDVLSASASDDKIAWYENEGYGGFVTHVISTVADEANWVFAADLDGDGDLDVLSTSSADDKVAWYENDGNENFSSHVITTIADGASSLFVIDMDGDGDLDVLSSSSGDDTIAWYENQNAQLLNGDYNKNGIVDDLDYQLWKDSFGSTTNLLADGNGDGTVNAADYTIWQDSIWRSTANVVKGHGAGAAGGHFDQIGSTIEGAPQIEQAVTESQLPPLSARGFESFPEKTISRDARSIVETRTLLRHNNAVISSISAAARHDAALLAWITADYEFQQHQRQLCVSRLASNCEDDNPSGWSSDAWDAAFASHETAAVRHNVLRLRFYR